ncbi:MAG: hypothetical protein ACI9S8_001199 [Chlamydiales bacterium]|jgi:hypothetical protein
MEKFRNARVIAPEVIGGGWSIQTRKNTYLYKKSN